MASFSIERILAKPDSPPRPIKPATVRIQPWPYVFSAMQTTEIVQLAPPPFSYPTRRRRKRYRTIFSEAQIALLENLYKTTPYPDLYQRESVAIHAGLQEERVEVWFKNRRARTRKVKRAEKQSLEKKKNEKKAPEKAEILQHKEKTE